MESFEETRRQIRIAIVIFLTLVPLSVTAFMAIEKLSLLDSIWLTIITLATIGYGDVYAKTELGRIFTMGLIVVGLGAFAFAAQAILGFFLSPEVSFIRQRRRIEHKITHLRQHYIISGEGELVDKTIRYLLQRVETRMHYDRRRFYLLVARVFGSDRKITEVIANFILNLTLLIRRRSGTLLDAVVVITDDTTYAAHLRRKGLLVVRGDSAENSVLRQAGIEHARALMVMESTDTDSLLTVLSASNYNSHLYITAATLDEYFAPKLLRVGANVVIPPFDVAGQFLNNATLRPAVHDFFNALVFDQDSAHVEIVQLFLYDSSPWIGQTIESLRLQTRFQASVIGVRCDDGSFIYAPDTSYVLKEDEVVLVVCPAPHIQAMRTDGERLAREHQASMIWQRLALQSPIPSGENVYTLEESEAAVVQLYSHYIICTGGRVAQNAINELDPNRAFVVISNDEAEAEDLLQRGFRVIFGVPSDEKVLKKAGIARALAVMIAIDDRARNVLTVLTCRTMNKHVLIVATAETDEMVPKLYQAGADRVLNPFHIAAQFVLMATTRPVVSEFVRYVLFNRETGLETTELYMEEGAPWIGHSIRNLELNERYGAGVIGIRLANHRFIYAPPPDHMIGETDVLIVVTPMAEADSLRAEAYGGADKRPKSIRTPAMLIGN